jgi:hypothetical protein
MLAELRDERQHVEEAIRVFERLALGQSKRRGRPPAWMATAAKRRGRPPVSKNKPKGPGGAYNRDSRHHCAGPDFSALSFNSWKDPILELSQFSQWRIRKHFFTPNHVFKRSQAICQIHGIPAEHEHVID